MKEMARRGDEGSFVIGMGLKFYIKVRILYVD
jgi:hypothetical protein